MSAEPVLLADDLAPGDRAAAARDWSDVRVHRVRDPADPDFALAYQRLWDVFGARGEMEQREVLAERLAWDPARPAGVAALLYELLVVRRAGEVAALRDHTCVVRRDAQGRARPGPLVVHLSHAWVAPAHRRSGLGAWLRALPLAAARRCARAAGAAGAPIVLAAEMEPPDPADAERTLRLRAYQRAGFSRIDGAAAPYAQPDFRPPEAIARDGPRALPLALVVRRVGREAEDAMPAAELAAVVDALYAVYAMHVPAAAIEPLRAAAAAWTARQPQVRLLPPCA